MCECKASVLVVDDTAFNIMPVRALLKAHYKIDIDIATNGLEAVEKFREGLNQTCGCSLRVPRLIIMDIGMPIMDGKEASSLINREQKKVMVQGDGEVTHIVARTSFSNKALKEECMAVGMKKVYNKPLKLIMLQEMMHNHFFRV